MIEKTQTVYETLDGKIFTSQCEAIEHEQDLLNSFDIESIVLKLSTYCNEQGCDECEFLRGGSCLFANTLPGYWSQKLKKI